MQRVYRHEIVSGVATETSDGTSCNTEFHKDEHDKQNKHTEFLGAFWAFQQLTDGDVHEECSAYTFPLPSQVCSLEQGCGCHLEQASDRATVGGRPVGLHVKKPSQKVWIRERKASMSMGGCGRSGGWNARCLFFKYRQWAFTTATSKKW